MKNQTENQVISMVSYKDKNAPFGYFAVEPNGLIVDANLTFLTWLDYERDEWVNTNIEESLSVPSKMIFHSFFFLTTSAKWAS